MAKKREKIQTMAGFIWKCIWLLFASICLAAGLGIFLQNQTFGFWMACGFACSLPVIGHVFKTMFKSMRDGARAGARDYEVSVSSSSVTVQNHPFRTAMVYLVINTILCLAVGVFYLSYKMLVAIYDIIIYIIKLVKEKKKKNAENTVNENTKAA